MCKNLSAKLVAVCIIAVALFSSCAPRVRTMVLKAGVPLSETDSVTVFESKEMVPPNAEVLGMVAVTDGGMTTKCNYPIVIGIAKAETRKMGGNGFLVTDHKLPSFWGSTCHQIAGTALRIYSSDEALDSTKTMLVADYLSLRENVKRNYSQVPKYDIQVNVGYGIITNRTKGLTGDAKRMEDELSSGLTWDVQFHNYPSNLGWGLIYSGYTASTTYQGIDNRVSLSYFAPMFSTKMDFAKTWMLKMDVGIGYLGYCSTLKDGYNEGKVTGATLGSNVAVGVEYKLNKQLGVGADLSILGGSFSKLNYHNITPDASMQISKENQMGAYRINMMLGLRYYFGKK